MHERPRAVETGFLIRAMKVALMLAAFALAAPALAQKTRIASQADLPRFSYALTGTASQLLEADDAAFARFAAKVRADVDRLLDGYEIEDKPTLRKVLGARLDLQELAGDPAAALQTAESLRALEDKPARKLLSEIAPRARLAAAIDAGTNTGPAYEAAFVRRYEALVAPLPWEVVQDGVKGAFARARLASRAGAIGRARTELDPAAETSHALDTQQAWQLVGLRVFLRALPLQPAGGDVLRAYIAKNEVAKPDIWPAREVTLTEADKLTPVLVGIWDSGVDVAVFPKQLFDDPVPSASGRHGVAYDDVGRPSTSWLYPITPEQQIAYPAFREQQQGVLDLQGGIASAEAAAVQNKFATYSPEQMTALMETGKALGHYIHGTHCAGIAVRGNPAARLVVARFNDQLPDLPFPPTEAWARQMGAAFQDMAAYFRSRKVRVVNMSWGDDAEEFETWLSKTGGGSDPELRKKRAGEIFAIWRAAIDNAIRSAPDTLFVTAAGNSDSNVAFVGDVPASLVLPNLISVGAVNQAGDETSFTSHGEAVVVHASGFQVDSLIPGGAHLRLSGTSMAAPNVVNLAAKLLALEPALTPAEVIALIRQGATTTDDGRRRLIDTTRSVALLKARPKSP